MEIKVSWHVDMWQEIKNNAMFTIHKESGKYPTEEWKKSMLMAEHSPIRTGRLIINCYDIPSFVIGHIVRHNLGFTPFVATLRKDRWVEDEVPNRNTLNSLRFDGNFQSFINITRRRECFSASKETREFWEAVLSEVSKFEKEVSYCCVRECVYRGGCPEYPSTCGWWDQFVERHKDENLLDIKNRYKIYNEERDNLRNQKYRK